MHTNVGPTSQPWNVNYSDVKDCPHGGADKWTNYLVVIHSLIAVSCIIGNSLVIYSVCRFTWLRTPTNLFVAVLATSDLILGISVPYYISFYFDVEYVCEKYPCLLRYTWTMFGALWSLVLMIGVAVDRYLLVLHPLQYPTRMTARRVWMFSLVSGLCVAGVVALPLVCDAISVSDDIKECDLFYIVEPAYAMAAVLSLVLLTLVLTTVLYALIFKEAWRHKCAVEAMNCAGGSREHKTTRMMVLIFGVSVLVCLPYFTVVALRYAYDRDSQPQELSSLKKLCVVFFFSKSVTNPFIYAWKNQDFQTAFQRIACCCRESYSRRSLHTPSSNSSVVDVRRSAMNTMQDHVVSVCVQDINTHDDGDGCWAHDDAPDVRVRDAREPRNSWF